MAVILFRLVANERLVQRAPDVEEALSAALQPDGLAQRGFELVRMLYPERGMLEDDAVAGVKDVLLFLGHRHGDSETGHEFVEVVEPPFRLCDDDGHAYHPLIHRTRRRTHGPRSDDVVRSSLDSPVPWLSWPPPQSLVPGAESRP
jgi:hypothetical protein